MNVHTLLEKMRSKDIAIHASNDYLRVNSINPLSNEQLKYLKRHKIEILEYFAHIEASNQLRKRYAYRFTLKDNKGGGTCITDSPPNEAEQELIDMFIGREIESLNLLNNPYYLH